MCLCDVTGWCAVRERERVLPNSCLRAKSICETNSDATRDLHLTAAEREREREQKRERAGCGSEGVSDS